MVKDLFLKLKNYLKKLIKFEGLKIGWLQFMVYACMIWTKYNATKHYNSYRHKNTHISNQLDN